MKSNYYASALMGFVSAIALTSGAWAQAPDAGPYMSIGGGYHQPAADDGITILPGPGVTTSAPAKLSFHDGYNVTGAFGYKFPSGFRAEMEIGWRSAKVRNMNSIPWDGRQQALGIMGNVLYDFNSAGRIQPYVGAGIGAGRNRFQGVAGPGSRSIPQATFSGHDTGVQWQLIGGMAVPLSSRLSLFADYRYIVLDNMAITSRTNLTSQLVNHDDRSHNVLIGLRFKFGHEEKRTETRQTASAPPPPPPPPPPPAPAKILAFFDFDKSNLRQDAKQIVGQAAQQYRSSGKAAIHLTGHTDTSGTDQYNVALSKRRADSVKAELIRLGVPAKDIVVSFRGESEPLVQTGDGVKEPQNRRVEIIYE